MSKFLKVLLFNIIIVNMQILGAIVVIIGLKYDINFILNLLKTNLNLIQDIIACSGFASGLIGFHATMGRYYNGEEIAK